MANDNKCQVCGAPSGMYPICYKCAQKRDKGLVVKNEKTGKWEEVKKEPVKKETKEKDKNNKCIVCGADAKYDLCYKCYTEKNKIKEELDGSVNTYDEAKDYYNNLKYNIFRLKNMDYAKTASLKLIALGEILEYTYKQKDHSKKAREDAAQLLNKKEDYLKLLEEKKAEKASAEENSDTGEREKVIEEVKQAKNEILDYRRVYPMTYRCRDGHYVRSKSEKFIDNYFYDNNILHAYEKRVVNEKTSEEYYPDFYLPTVGRLSGKLKGTYLEFFGLEDNKKYLQTEMKKLAYYKSVGYDVIEVREKHISCIRSEEHTSEL